FETVRLLRRALAVDPLRESVHRRLLEALAASGDHAAAVQAYRDLRLLLYRELNAVPAPETVAFFERIEAQLAPLKASRSDARFGAARRPAGRLPCPASSLIGRERELEKLVEQLRIGTRETRRHRGRTETEGKRKT